MRRVLCLALFLAMAACATGPSLQSRMAAYIGSSGDILVQNLGVPDKQFALNGFQYLAYIRQQTTVTAPPPLFYGGFYGGGFGPYGGYYGPPSITVWRCEITFTLQHDKVLNVTLRGNYCQ
jgi:hypothetical protein